MSRTLQVPTSNDKREGGTEPASTSERSASTEGSTGSRILGERADKLLFESPLLITGVRCTLRYVVLPLALPLVSISTSLTLEVATNLALAALLGLDILAAASVITTLRRIWQPQHPRRWHYLPLALPLLATIGYFFVRDARLMFS